MTQLFIDTNVVIDLLARRVDYYDEAAQLFSMADRGELTLSISVLSIANTNYIISKQKGQKAARKILRKLMVLVKVLELDEKLTDLALNDESFPDFEDGIQYYSALENQCDVIITRNKKDFKHSSLTVLTAKEYLAMNSTDVSK